MPYGAEVRHGGRTTLEGGKDDTAGYLSYCVEYSLPLARP